MALRLVISSGEVYTEINRKDVTLDLVMGRSVFSHETLMVDQNQMMWLNCWPNI